MTCGNEIVLRLRQYLFIDWLAMRWYNKDKAGGSIKC